jgi:hypothetical protein
MGVCLYGVNTLKSVYVIGLGGGGLAREDLVGENLSSQKDEKWRIMGPRVVTRGNHISTCKRAKESNKQRNRNKQGNNKEDLLHRWEESTKQAKNCKEPPTREQTARTSEAREQQRERGTSEAWVFFIVWAERVVWGVSRVVWVKRVKESEDASEVGVERSETSRSKS